MLRCIFGELYIWCNASMVLINCILRALHLCCYVYALLVCYALASLVCWIVGGLQLWWIISIFLWCTASSVRCIFGVMYMHYWYAMHRDLWCASLTAITIVQCIFVALYYMIMIISMMTLWQTRMVEGKGGAEPVCSGERWSANRPWDISMVVVVKVKKNSE